MDSENSFERIALDNSRNFMRVNINTEQVYVYKLRGILNESQDIPYNYKEYFDRFLEEEHINFNDLWMFDKIRDPQSLINKYREKQGTALIYRRLQDTKVIWSRLDFLISSDHSCIYIYGHDLDSEESAFFAAYSGYASRFHKMVVVSLRKDRYFVLQEPHAESVANEKVPECGYEEMITYISRFYIHPDYEEDFRKHFSKEAIHQYFADGNSEMFYYCRRKAGGIYRWVKYLVVAAQNEEETLDNYYVYVEDVNKEGLMIMDYQNFRHYTRFYRRAKNQIESYYQNMSEVLYGLTEPFVDFYMVDLEKDLYIRYKFRSGTLKQNIPVIGSYSESSIDYIKNHCTGLQAEQLSQYCTAEKLREAMKNCMTLEYEFYTDSGVKLRTICCKHESKNGIPTKVVCRTIACSDEKKLKITTFGNFQVMHADKTPIYFTRKQSKQLLAYLVDRQGYLVTNQDIVRDILEKPEDDKNARKYCSTLIRRAINDLENAGYKDVIIKETKGVRINTDAVDCDYYHLLNGDTSYLIQYHNEYMKEYSWAESTNAEILSMCDK